MKKYVIAIFFVFTTVVFFSCEKNESEIISNSTSEELSDVNTVSSLKFAKILARAVENSDIRKFIREQSLLQVDNDYDVIYQYVKDLPLDNGKSFRENLSLYCNSGDISQLDSITNVDMTLTILVPYIKNVFNAKTWNTDNIIPCVACRNEDDDVLPTYNAQGELSYLERYSKPEEPVLVVKSNERLTTNEDANAVSRSGNVATNGISNNDGVFGYFIDDEFDNIKKHKAKVTTRATTTSFQPEVFVNFDTTDKMYIASLAKESSARDYIYYGISSVLGADEGTLDKDYREYITYIQFNNYSALSHINDTSNQASDADWSDGNLEIVFDFVFLTKDAAISTVKKMISVRTENLFDDDIQATKKYYLSDPVEVFNWDLAKFGDTYRIDVSEYDSGTQSQYTSSITSVYGNNFKSEASSTLFGLVKVGANYSYSETTTKQASTVITSTNNSDPLGSVFINFFDPIYTNDKVYITWTAYDSDTDVGIYTDDAVIERGKVGLDQYIEKLQNGLHEVDIRESNPFPYENDYYIEINNYSSFPTDYYNLYTSNTGMITLGIEPRKIYQ